MQPFFIAAVGSFFGALGGFLANMVLAGRINRRDTTSRMISEFLSDSFLVHRISMDDTWQRMKAGDISADDVAGGFWYPGTPTYYTGEIYGDLNAHQHLEAYIGYIVRLADALDHRRLNRGETRAALGMHLLWADALLQQTARTAARQAEVHNVPIPSWTKAAGRVHDLLTVSGATVHRGRP